MAESEIVGLEAIRSELQVLLGFSQPSLAVDVDKGIVMVSGVYYLNENDGPSQDGPLAEYQIRLELDPRFPAVEPRLYETSGAIPAGRHLNPDGTCCTCVWEEWLAATPEPTVPAYMNGPLRDYFLSQRHFALTGEWPFGEREHGLEGYLNGCAETLGVARDPKTVVQYLVFLRQGRPKGHWLCPCNSGLIVRKCHGKTIFDLSEKVPPELAARMFDRIRKMIA